MADKMDDKIRKTMQDVEVPEIVDQAMDQAFTKIREMNKENQSKVTDLSRYKRRRWSGRKMAAMVAVAALAVGGSVFAGVKLYQMHLEKEAAYSVSLGVEASDEVTKLELLDDVEAKVNVIPDGCKPYEKYDLGYWNEDEEIGFYAQAKPYLIDTDEDAVVNAVVDAESVMIGDHEALYIEEKHGYREGWMNGTLLVLYPEFHRLEEITVWGYATKQDLLQFAEGVELVSNGKQVAASDLPKWSEYVSIANENNEIQEASEDEDYPVSVAKADLHLAKMNESVEFHTFMMNESMVEVTVEANVRDFQVEDYGSDLAYFVNYGDGKNSVVTVVKKEERDICKATATMEVTNTTDQDFSNVYFYCPLLMLNESAEELKIDWLADGISDSIEYEDTYAESGEMDSCSVNGEELVKNYISSLKPGETATVEISWLVDKAQADKLYMVLNGDDIFTEKTMKAPIIKLEK